MNERKAQVIAMRAAILAQATGHMIDEAIRYVAASYIIKDSELVTLSLLTGISTIKLKDFQAIDSSMAIF